MVDVWGYGKDWHKEADSLVVVVAPTLNLSYEYQQKVLHYFWKNAREEFKPYAEMLDRTFQEISDAEETDVSRFVGNLVKRGVLIEGGAEYQGAERLAYRIDPAVSVNFVVPTTFKKMADWGFKNTEDLGLSDF